MREHLALTDPPTSPREADVSDDISNEVAKATPSKSEALDFTDQLRDSLDNLCDVAESTAKLLRESQEKNYWEALGYDDWQEWYETEFEEQIEFLKNVKLSIDTRVDIVESLSTGGLSNRQIATTLGVNEKTVRNDMRRLELSSADMSASNEVDAAGQRVEEVGLIDDTQSESQVESGWTQPVTEKETTSANDNKAEEVDRFDGINFDALFVATPNQIIQAEPTEDTPDYFTPRSVQPSWSPPMVGELPPPPVKRYDDDQPEFLDEPMKIEKPVQPHKSDDKHCKTCACNLLP